MYQISRIVFQLEKQKLRIISKFVPHMLSFSFPPFLWLKFSAPFPNIKQTVTNKSQKFIIDSIKITSKAEHWKSWEINILYLSPFGKWEGFVVERERNENIWMVQCEICRENSLHAVRGNFPISFYLIFSPSAKGKFQENLIGIFWNIFPSLTFPTLFVSLVCTFTSTKLHTIFFEFCSKQREKFLRHFFPHGCIEIKSAALPFIPLMMFFLNICWIHCWASFCQSIQELLKEKSSVKGLHRCLDHLNSGLIWVSIIWWKLLKEDKANLKIKKMYIFRLLLEAINGDR